MTNDDEFTPRLGRQRSRGSGKRAKRYLSAVIVATIRAGGRSTAGSRRFDGSRTGRGASVARLLAGRDRFAGFRARRAVVKTRLVRLRGQGLAAARAHLRYLQRDGVTREGMPGELYARDRDLADGKAFVERAAGDRHQFRFIVSAEDGAEYPDLKPYVRRLMQQVEKDLGTSLDWVAVDHFNTGHPHSHIILRGVDDRGENLVIAREYISRGLRERASELATLDLGPRSDAEIEAGLRREIGLERLTSIDRQLFRDMDDEHVVSAASRDALTQTLRAGRLRKLAELHLATHIGNGRWRLAEELDQALRTLGERGDIIRTIQHELSARGLERPKALAIADNLHAARPIVGGIISSGFADEHRDRRYLLVDGIDGQVHYIDIGHSDPGNGIGEGAAVEITARGVSPRQSDRTIDAVAGANCGCYSAELHRQHDPQAADAFIEAHSRRLETLRSARVGVDRAADGTWNIPDDYLAQVGQHEKQLLVDRPADINVLAPLPISQLIEAQAITWLDRELLAGRPLPARDVGYGKELKSALDARQRWLLGRDLAEMTDGLVRLRPGALQQLQRQELLKLGDEVARASGRVFVEVHRGDTFEGKLVRRVDAAGGQYALVERSHEFTLVPWRAVLAKRLGSPISGIIRDGDVTWEFARDRGRPGR